LGDDVDHLSGSLYTSNHNAENDRGELNSKTLRSCFFM
jgi:hypothetical protein